MLHEAPTAQCCVMLQVVRGDVAGDDSARVSNARGSSGGCDMSDEGIRKGLPVASGGMEGGGIGGWGVIVVLA